MPERCRNLHEASAVAARLVKVMKRAATDAGISDKTLRRARKRLCDNSEVRDRRAKSRGINGP